MRSYDEMMQSFDGTKLYLKAELPEKMKAVCVFVHGLCEHEGRYDYVAEKFHEAKIGTYRFDHRGHGKSEGEESHYSDYNEMLKDTDEVVNKAMAENPEIPIFLLGHSMGGFCVALYGAKYPEKEINGIITSGALTRDNAKIILGIQKGMDVHTRIPNALAEGVCSVIGIIECYKTDPLVRKSFTAGLCYAIADGLKWYEKNVGTFSFPILMMHGEKDGLVSVQDTYDFFTLVSSEDRQMKIYGGLLHEILNEFCRGEVIADTVAWIERRA